MELTLNLVWVCVAIAGILVQIGTLSRAAASEHSASHVRKIVAMGCTLVILFFVISMTDDLHDQEILIEDRKFSRITVGTETMAHSGSARPVPMHFLLFLPRPVFSVTLPVARRGIETSKILLVAAIDHESFCGRAPPSSLL